MEGPSRRIEPGETDEDGRTWERGTRWRLPDREWMREQYEVKGKSIKEIAEEQRTSIQCVRRWMRLLGVVARDQGRPKREKEEEQETSPSTPPEKSGSGVWKERSKAEQAEWEASRTGTVES